MICLKLNRFFYGLSRMQHLSEFVWTLRSSVLVVFNNFLLTDATDRNKISSDQKRFFIAPSLYPLSFFANTPFQKLNILYFCLKRTLLERLCLPTQNQTEGELYASLLVPSILAHLVFSFTNKQNNLILLHIKIQNSFFFSKALHRRVMIENIKDFNRLAIYEPTYSVLV